VTEVTALVPRFVAVTVTPGTTDPLASFTSPLIVPRPDWARAELANNGMRATARMAQVKVGPLPRIL
jgi:hypothetical protein